MVLFFSHNRAASCMAFFNTRFACLHNCDYVCFACVVKFGSALRCDGIFVRKRYQPVILSRYNIQTLWDIIHNG